MWQNILATKQNFFAKLSKYLGYLAKYLHPRQGILTH
jgi:hypothetical protein